MKDSFNIPAKDGLDEFTEKKSRFIGAVRYTNTEADALRFIAEKNEEHKSAGHNVYAYSIRDNNIMRYTDNGEPQGTAGLPVLDVFRHAEVFDFCCVVTRYFGGVLLGTGGLTRAYSRAAKIALESSGIAVMRLWTEASLTSPYNMADSVKKTLTEHGAKISGVDYGADVSIAFFSPAEDYNSVCAEVFDVTAGRVAPEKLGDKYMAIADNE